MHRPIGLHQFRVVIAYTILNSLNICFSTIKDFIIVLLCLKAKFITCVLLFMFFTVSYRDKNRVAFMLAGPFGEKENLVQQP